MDEECVETLTGLLMQCQHVSVHYLLVDHFLALN